MGEAMEVWVIAQRMLTHGENHLNAVAQSKAQSRWDDDRQHPTDLDIIKTFTN